MDLDPRPFESVNVGMTNVEAGEDRFSNHGIFYPPPIAYWRNNLTALSQRYNLYFIATRNAIVVYKPEFPFQRLGRVPCLMILPTLANPDAQGYIDPRSPHDINHLIVGDLGTQEILLCATDSGNVTAYYTKSLEEAIRNGSYTYCPALRNDRVQVREFFAQWVHESAWGLSIHTQARMIAVSANTAYHVQTGDPSSKITVFAFALTEEGEEKGTEEKIEKAVEDEVADSGGDDPVDATSKDNGNTRQLEWQEWECDGSNQFPPPRNKNYKIILGGIDGHDFNVPSISFVNSDLDVEGKWLLSTDIGGEMKMWQIWQGKCFKSWDLAEKRSRSAFFRRREGGWLVAALNPRAFRLAETMDEFCGHSKAPQYHGHVGESYDITHIVRVRTPGNSAAFPAVDTPFEEDSGDEDDHESAGSWSDMDQSDIHDDDVTLDEFATVADAFSSADIPSITESPYSQHETADQGTGVMQIQASESDADGDVFAFLEAETSSSDSSTAIASDDGDLESAVSHNIPDSGRSSSPGEQGNTMSLILSTAPGQADISHDNSQEAMSHIDERGESYVRGFGRFGHGTYDTRSKFRFSSVSKSHPEATPPSIPVLQCSASNLRLIMAPEADSAHVFCANILKQILPREIEESRQAHLDRLNMMQHIPELGLVIVASQLGRCAICTLTKSHKTGTLGLRVDWTLPTQKQEARRLRPSLPLLGIATSPIQGHSKREAHPSNHRPDTPVKWGVDNTVDGVPTTFDPNIIVVRESVPDQDYTGVQNIEKAPGSGDDISEHRLKRKRPSFDSDTEPGSAISIESSAWETPSSVESWQATGSSRRYRLMLTYMDMTVLTYEIWRGVERQDIQQAEVSALDLVD
ncbi:hypothetical protein ABEF93_000424 [Exophiala dermatitidis]